MARNRERLVELDAAIAGLSRGTEQSEASSEPRRRGMVAISEQVRAVAASTEKAYVELKAEMEDAVSSGRLVIEIDPVNVRDTAYRDRDEAGFRDQAFVDLMTSIEREGQLAPVALRRTADNAYEVVFGHRRVRAARALGRRLRAVILDGDDKALVRRMVAENAVRQDISPLEKARAWHRLLADKLLSRQELADLLKVSPQQVSNVAGLTALPAELLEALGDWRALGINESRRLLTAWESAEPKRRLTLLDEVRVSSGDASVRARLLVQRLSSTGTDERVNELIRARDGRKLARLTRSGAQLVLRFQPDLDEGQVKRVAHRLAELWDGSN
jgi:ParB family chromosome partitioning protein